ncbi:lantibiotic immunity ABC transporter MutE/EpiE family permease subunit [Clostridium estertheticum]|uniref:Lantibiotic immunity ABC transporter MutE/EpiE family permease subunit n=1 Tax=Clostridium estertheticum TaxID=238834 RepID=A0A7Y3WS11_9CLOT|nr:lantibiotic immunity ABC transporter MutE/EpiE family permease subunit [Clostridium estertheticum]NNU75523.1 lantibiotic immunity ABC transporter MutE/EpiE family permease subunit [Clostridium estertheticum]WBL46933.1 lantibiotic immunity ABC transporter MutE/EpiE family permease subunit [Clostridium estertheticum]
MLKYLQAENLKCKRTFIKKLILIAPIVTLLFGFMSGRYFESNSFNWWYMLILPGYISIMAVMTNEKEQKKLRYRAVFGLPISLKKVWISKVLVNGIYMTFSCIVFIVGIFLGSYLRITPIPAFSAFAGAGLIAVTSLWQIPLCMFLAKKLGMLGTVLINVGIGTVLNVMAVKTSMWWISPYSWTTRIMCSIVGILPNGTLADIGDPLRNPVVIPIGTILSIILFALLMIVTANWFEKQEVN